MLSRYFYKRYLPRPVPLLTGGFPGGEDLGVDVVFELSNLFCRILVAILAASEFLPTALDLSRGWGVVIALDLGLVVVCRDVDLGIVYFSIGISKFLL